MGLEDGLQLLVVVDAKAGQFVGDDRRFALELEQLAAPWALWIATDAGTKNAITARVVVSSTARRTRRLMRSGSCRRALPFEAVADTADR